MNGGRTGGGRAQKKRVAGNKEKIGHKSHCFYAVHPGLEDSILQQAQEKKKKKKERTIPGLRVVFLIDIHTGRRE